MDEVDAKFGRIFGGGQNLGYTEAQRRAFVKQAKIIDSQGEIYSTRKRGRPLVYFIFEPEGVTTQSAPTVLLVGSIHGNEFSAVYTSFKVLADYLTGVRALPEKNRIVFVPIANPDGLLNRSAVRYNGSASDLNRSFFDWENQATADAELARVRPADSVGEVVSVGGQNKRVHPKEVLFLQALIRFYGGQSEKERNPNFFMVALHTPWNILDPDFPKKSEKRFTRWLNAIQKETCNREGVDEIPIKDTATYNLTSRDINCVGWSLGNLAVQKGIPSLTIELPNRETKTVTGEKARDTYPAHL